VTSLAPVVESHSSSHLARFISASDDSSMKLWDVEHSASLTTFNGHLAPLTALQSSIFKTATASRDGTIKLWDIDSARWNHSIDDHHRCVTELWMSDTKLISGDEYGTIIVRCFSSSDN
jgi:WD40 repeat protein